MSKTVTLRLDDPAYRLFKAVAERQNRPLSNFIETAVLRFVEEHGTADESEMAEIRDNAALNRSLKRGLAEAKRRRGAVLVSEDDWRAIQETLYLLSIPGMRESIVKGLKTPVRRCSKEVQW